MEAEQSAEYAAAVQRVGWSVMTQKYQQKLAAMGEGKKLRDKAREVIAAASKAGNSDNMEDGIKDGPELKSKSIKSYDEAIAALAEAVKCLPDSDSEYVKVFKKMAKSLGGRIEACKKVWQKVNVDNVASRKAGARRN